MKKFPFVVSGLIVFGLVGLFIVGTQWKEFQLSKELQPLSDYGTMQTENNFKAVWEVSNRNGEIVNFWVENRGIGDVEIKIDGEENQAIIAPGGQGHIVQQVKKTLEEHTFIARAVRAGEELNIQYKIAQKQNPS